MTRRSDIEKHLHSLDEIHDIMNSMKNLSYIESRKISGFLDVQHAMVKHIETVAADFLKFYPDELPASTETPVDVYLLVGTERGFCGDFNHVLLGKLKAISTTQDMDKLRLLVVGYKLETLLAENEKVISFIDGASVVDEVDEVVNQITTQLASIQQQYGSLNLSVIYHDAGHHVTSQQVLPPFQKLLQRQQHEPYAPELNLEPRIFFLDLSYHYLFIVLYEVLYSSLMAECRQRVEHLEASGERMEEQSEALQRQANVLRQEEIIEEIEVILLNTVSLDGCSLHE